MPVELPGSYVTPPGQDAIVHSIKVTGGSPWYDLSADAACDGQVATDVTCVSGSAVVNSASGLFRSRDVGKIYDLTAGSAPGITGTQVGTVLSVQSATQATLSVTANANATNATLVWGTDDTVAVNTWAARSGRLRVSAGALSIVTGTVTFTQPRTQVDGGGGSFWVSKRIAATKAFDIGALIAGAYLADFSITAPSGVTGRLIEGISSNEAGTLLLMRDIRVTSTDVTDHDYLVFLKAMVASIEHCSFQNTGSNPFVLKALAHSAVISASQCVDSNIIGRMYTNAQAYAIRNTTTGPLRVANNSAADGSGTAQQTTKLTVDGSSYVYSGTLSGTDFPCVESVAATANGEGAAGGCFPNLTLEGYFVFGGGAGATQNAVSGSFAASQGGIGIISDGATWQQSASSVATTVRLFNGTAGAGAIFMRGGGANIVSGVTTAKLVNVTGGTMECVAEDFYPSGQATVWQHPTVSGLTLTPQNLPASLAWTRNSFPVPYDIWITPTTNAVTKVEISPDNGTTVYVLWNGTGATVVPLYFRWPPGSYLRFTYAGGQPTYMLVPAP